MICVDIPKQKGDKVKYLGKNEDFYGKEGIIINSIYSSDEGIPGKYVVQFTDPRDIMDVYKEGVLMTWGKEITIDHEGNTKKIIDIGIIDEKSYHYISNLYKSGTTYKSPFLHKFH